MFNLTITKAIKKLGQATTMESLKKELLQHHSKQTWHPVKYSDTNGYAIIRSHTFLKEKYKADGSFDKLKSRLVAGGNEQDRNLYDDLSSPTASTESLFIMASLAALQCRHVYTVDIGGAYIGPK
jgi:hypothetical protein